MSCIAYGNVQPKSKVGPVYLQACTEEWISRVNKRLVWKGEVFCVITIICNLHDAVHNCVWQVIHNQKLCHHFAGAGTCPCDDISSSSPGTRYRRHTYAQLIFHPWDSGSDSESRHYTIDNHYVFMSLLYSMEWIKSWKKFTSYLLWKVFGSRCAVLKQWKYWHE